MRVLHKDISFFQDPFVSWMSEKGRFSTEVDDMVTEPPGILLFGNAFFVQT